MATSNPALKRTSPIGVVTVSTATPLENSSALVLGLPFRPVGVVYQVTTAVTVAPAVMTLTWNPNPANQTGAVPIATWSQPIEAVDTVGYVDFNKNDDTAGTVIGAAGPKTGYGIGGSKRFVGEADIVCGPGGELHLVSNAGATAGVVHYWLVYEQMSIDAAVGDAVTRIAPTTVG